MTFVKLGVVLSSCYVGVVALMYFGQRSLLYFPDPARHSPASVGVAAEEVLLRSADGVELVGWHAAPREGSPVLVYFQGNGGGLDLRAHRFRALTAQGVGLLALNYRGYGGSSGHPTETGLLRDARAAYEFAAGRYGADRVVLWGESLGSGIAVATAAEHQVARLVLESPYTSIVDVAAAVYWYLPVRPLVKDPFRANRWVGRVTAPVLVLQGARDEVIPIAIGRRLYDLIRAPKRFISLPNAGHNDHDEYGGFDKALPFVARGFTADFPPDTS